MHKYKTLPFTCVNLEALHERESPYDVMSHVVVVVTWLPGYTHKLQRKFVPKLTNLQATFMTSWLAENVRFLIYIISKYGTIQGMFKSTSNTMEAHTTEIQL